MKISSLTLILVFTLVLVGCHWDRYSAAAEIQIRQRGFPMVTGSRPDIGSDASELTAEAAGEIQIIENNDVLLPIIQNLNLNQTWARRFGSKLTVLTDKEALDHLRKALKFEVNPGTAIIKITAFSEVPQEAADIANAIADHYKAMRDEEDRVGAERGLDVLRLQIVDQQKLVDSMKVAIEKTGGPDSTETSKDATLSDANRRLVQQQNILDLLNLRVKQVTEADKLTESPVRIISRAVAPPE